MALSTFPNPLPGQIRLHTLSAEGSGDLTDEDLQAEADVEIAQILVEKPATTGVHSLLLSQPDATPSGAAIALVSIAEEDDVTSALRASGVVLPQGGLLRLSTTGAVSGHKKITVYIRRLS